MSNSTYSLAPWLRPGRALAAAGLVTALAACGGSGSPAPAGHTGTPAAAGSTAPAGGTGQTPAGGQAPVPAESNPPGDIPDTTVYVPYQSAAGHLLLAPTVSSARATTIPALQASTLAFGLQAARAVSLAAGPAIEIIYQVNSPPNQVTGRQYRLVIQRFELYRNGRGAVIALSSAVGSDNVDPWRIVSQSFRWM